MNAPPEHAVGSRPFHYLWLSIAVTILLVLSIFLTSCNNTFVEPTPDPQTQLPANSQPETYSSQQSAEEQLPAENLDQQLDLQSKEQSYPAVSFDFDYDRFVYVGMGGFAFDSIPGYLNEVNVSQATISDQTGRVLITMTGSLNQSTQPLDILITDFVDVMSSTFLDLQISQKTPLEIQKFNGLEVAISGKLSNKLFSGKVIGVLPGENSQFLAQAIGLQMDGVDYWLSKGEQDFDAILASLQFFEPTDSACLIADQTDYGFTPENPIRVGAHNNDINRQELFLQNLRGPNFDPLSYQLMQSQDFGQSTLQVYEIMYPGSVQPVNLYIDSASYEYPRAPQGFKCPQPFNLPPP